MDASINASSLAERVQSITWYHSIDLPGGILTPGTNNSKLALSRLQLAESLIDKSVLDIGAWDGFYSFEAVRRGARRVLATDSYAWNNAMWGQTGFNVAREALGMVDSVEDQFIDVMELTPDNVGGRYDIVLFLGVLYHLPDPLGAIARVASVTEDLLILETETALDWLPWASGRLWRSREFARDATNYWSLNRRAIEVLLERVGFHDVRVVYHTPQARRVARAIRNGIRSEVRSRAQLIDGFRSRRIVIHARRESFGHRQVVLSKMKNGRRPSRPSFRPRGCRHR